LDIEKPVMKSKLLNLVLIITSLLGYLEWGGGNASFLFQAEGEVLSKMFSDPSSVLHPFIVFPMLAQLLLVITLFQHHPSKWLTYISIGGLGLLLGFMLVIGLISLNLKIILSVIPFLVTAVLAVIHYRKARSA
jgi:hypothetical protein